MYVYPVNMLTSLAGPNEGWMVHLTLHLQVCLWTPGVQSVMTSASVRMLTQVHRLEDTHMHSG